MKAIWDQFNQYWSKVETEFEKKEKNIYYEQNDMIPSVCQRKKIQLSMNGQLTTAYLKTFKNLKLISENFYMTGLKNLA